MVKKTTAKDGDHVVTMREVAKAAGVSIKTVSNVVNDYEFVSDATRAKVHKAIDELGYVINVSARNLRRGSTGIIALAIPDLQLSYFAQLSSLIITEAKKLGLRVIVEPTLYSREGELDALHGSQTAMVDGLIYSPLELGPDDAAEVEVDYPLVLIGERIFNETELACRLEVELEKYTMKVQIESRVLGDLAINHIVPTAVIYQNRLLENLRGLRETFTPEEYEILSADRKELIREISHRVTAIKMQVREMTEARKVANHMDNYKDKAFAYEETVRPYLESIREHIDNLEMEIDDEIWPLPKYRELLFTK